MIVHTVKLTIPNARAEQFYDFMINPDDKNYQKWWKGEHLRFHIVKRGNQSHLGDVVFMDEYLGKKRRLVFFAVVLTADRPNKIRWQMKKAGVRLPAFVTLELRDSVEGIRLKHELRLGYRGAGKLLDPFIRLYFNKAFQEAFNTHCKIEWYKLERFINGE